MPPRRAALPRSRRSGVIGVIGEVMMTLGVLVLLFLGWQLWLNDLIVGGMHNESGARLAGTWQTAAAPRPSDEAPAPPASAQPEPAPQEPAPVQPAPVEPVVLARPALESVFAVLRVPRWGEDYARPVAEGTALQPVLNSIGIGHYTTTQLPGEVGNVALAAHRKAYGGAFAGVPDLRVGDAIVLQTQDGWYTYRFRNLEYVTPKGVGVLAPVPQLPDAAPGDRYITLTTCNPLYSTAERVVAYGVYESFTPTADGEPESLSAAMALAGGR